MSNKQNITKSISLEDGYGKLLLKVDSLSKIDVTLPIGQVMDAFEREANSMLTSAAGALSDANLPQGKRHVTSTHSIKVNGRTLRIKVKIETTRLVDDFMLVCFADGLIARMIPCIFLALKPEETTAFFLARVSRLLVRSMNQMAMDMYRQIPPSMLFAPFEATTSAAVATPEQ